MLGKKNNKIQKIINDDCVKQMKMMSENSVDIIICDPPYNIGKDFGNNSDKQEMDAYLNGVMNGYLNVFVS